MAEDRLRVHQGTRELKLNEIEPITWNNGFVSRIVVSGYLEGAPHELFFHGKGGNYHELMGCKKN
jgi:hypothetical protein